MCDSPEFFSERICTARIPHKCCELGCAINPGDRYELVSGRWDGYFDTYKTCLTCVEKRKACSQFGHENWGDACFTYCGLADQMHEVRTWSREGALLVAKLNGVELVEE